MDWKQWAQRRGGRVGGGPPPEAEPSFAPRAAHQHQHAPAAPPSLPAPPPGYAWVQTDMGLAMVQIQPQAIAAPPRQPQAVTPFGGGGYGHPAPRVAHAPAPKTCMLVRPGDRDTYGEFLSGVPDMLPPSHYDAMAGRPNPAVVEELSHLQEWNDTTGMATGAPAPVEGFAARGAVIALRPVSNVRTGPELGSVPLPPSADPENGGDPPPAGAN